MTEVELNAEETILELQDKGINFYIFSKSGFTKGLQDLADQGEVKLITLDDMYR